MKSNSSTIKTSHINICVITFSIAFSIITQSIFNIIFLKYNSNFLNLNKLQNIDIKEIVSQETNEIKPQEENLKINEEEIIKNEIAKDQISIDDIYFWKIEIPKYNISAQINEDVTEDVLNESVGHFCDTGILSGNICLASHNRGYKASYFGNLKDMQKQDQILYYLNDKIYVFEYEKETIVDETNVKVLEETDQTQLTLITCVENVPQYRRCVIAKLIEIKKEKIDEN